MGTPRALRTSTAATALAPLPHERRTRSGWCAADDAGDVSAETGARLWDGWPMDEAQAVARTLTPQELAAS